MDLTALVDELKAAIRAVWPETATAGTGIFEQRQIRNIPFEQLALPYACIVYGDESEGEWAADVLAVELEIALYYVGRDSNDVGILRGKLQEMQDYLWPVEPFTQAQIIGGPTKSSSDSAAMNETLRVRQIQAIAGAIGFRVQMTDLA